MNKENVYTALATFLLLGIMICTWLKYELTTLHINHVTYVQTGLMSYNDHGTDIYVPIYQRKN